MVPNALFVLLAPLVAVAAAACLDAGALALPRGSMSPAILLASFVLANTAAAYLIQRRADAQQ